MNNEHLRRGFSDPILAAPYGKEDERPTRFREGPTYQQQRAEKRRQAALARMAQRPVKSHPLDSQIQFYNNLIEHCQRAIRELEAQPKQPEPLTAVLDDLIPPIMILEDRS